MGVDVFTLQSRTMPLLIGDKRFRVGSLARLCKLGQLEHVAFAETLACAEKRANSVRLPKAVCAVDVANFSKWSNPSRKFSAGIVLGWEEGRSYVTDLAWGYLKVIGYCINLPGADNILHEERGGFLFPVGSGRAVELGILNSAGRLIRSTQPIISECQSVRKFAGSYALAQCRLDSNQEVELITSLKSDQLPDLDWFIGKRPDNINSFSA